jgi:hypothetical protein
MQRTLVLHKGEAGRKTQRIDDREEGMRQAQTEVLWGVREILQDYLVSHVVLVIASPLDFGDGKSQFRKGRKHHR